MKNNTQRWLKGIVSALIQGGSGAVVSTITGAVIDPDKLNPMTQTLHFFELGTSVFLVTGILHIMMFLQQHPVPDDGTTFTPNPNPPIQNKP